MVKNDPAESGATPQIADIRSALMLLSRLPLGAGDTGAPRGAAAAWAFPLAGAVLAGLATLLGAIALWLGLPAGLVAALILAALALMSGAMHEDGLADCADGFWGGWEKTRRLEIMKDSRIGTYGVMALLLVTIGRWSALSALIGAGHWAGPLLAAAMLSRAGMVGLMAVLPNARGAGLAASVGAPPRSALLWAGALAFALSVLVVGSWAIVAAAGAALAAWATGRLATAKIGGHTGDVLGASQQLGDLAALAACAAML